MSYKNNVLTVGEGGVNLPFPYRVLSYGGYIQNKNLYSEKKLLYDNSVAFVDNKKNIFVPNWYNKKISIVAVPKNNNLLLTDFEVGDFLVHRDCGVGKFTGVASRDNTGGQDFIIIKYADGRVFVDVHSLYKISL